MPKVALTMQPSSVRSLWIREEIFKLVTKIYSGENSTRAASECAEKIDNIIRCTTDDPTVDLFPVEVDEDN